MYGPLHVSYDFPSHVPLLVETALAAALWLFLLLRLRRRRRQGTGDAVDRPPPLLAGLVSRPSLGYLAVAVFAATLVLGSYLVLGPPVPTVHDEFSYILGAETWAGGRLTNPSPPRPVHFEQPHVLVEPTRASKYPIGQAAILAASIGLTSHPWPALPFLSALLAMTALWMFRGWLPDAWALVGALFVAGGPGFGHWAQSYWGGSLAAIGGGLLFGALPRLRGDRGSGSRTTLAATALASGLAILAVSRPFEGAWISLFVVGILSWSLLRARRFGTLARVAGLVLVVLGPLAAFQATLNRAVTGNPWRMPYQLHQEISIRRSLFLWNEASNEPVRHNRPLEALYRGYDDPLPGRSRALVFLEQLAGRTPRILVIFLGVGLLPGLILSLRDRGSRLGLACIAFGIVGSSVTWSWWPHYTAPIALLCVAIALRGIRDLGLPAGLALLLIVPRLVATSVELPAYRPDPDDWPMVRGRLAEDLEKRPGPDLVLVPQTVLPNSTWTANPADLDRAEVLWVWDRGSEENRALRRSFPDRRVWRLRLEPTAILEPLP